MNLESVRFSDLSLGYGQASLLNGLTFDLPRGQTVRVRGGTGSGKSAVMKVAVGLLSPLSGDYFLNDQAVKDMSFEEFLPFRLLIGYSFDLGGLLSNRTLRENLSLPLEYHKRFPAQEIRERVDETLAHFDLIEVADRRPSAVAGSQRKACCVARALVMKPQFLILDDPTVGLGPFAARALTTYLTGNLTRGGLRFLMVTTSDQNLVSALDPKTLEINNHSLGWVA